MPNHTASSSPAEPEYTALRSQTAVSSAELESIRQDSLRVLGSVAAALEVAGQQKQALLADMQAARQSLQALANERESVEARLALSRAELEQAATRLEQAELQRVGILGEVEGLLSASLQSRAALTAEIVALERQRDQFTRVAAGSAVAAARTSSAAVVPRPAPLAVMRTLGTDVERFLLAHPVDPGFSNVATALFIALLLAMALLLSPLTQVFGGLQLLAVTSGSMAPGIPTGSMVGVSPVPASALMIGDVITFANPATPGELVTHRIVSLDVRDGQTMLTTKGDANDTPDALSAPAGRAVGRVEFALPILGDVMLWLGSPMAKAVSVCLAVLALVLSVASVRRSTR